MGKEFEKSKPILRWTFLHWQVRQQPFQLRFTEHKSILYSNIKQNVYVIDLGSVTQGLAAQPFELKDWEREIYILGAIVRQL